MDGRIYKGERGKMIKVETNKGVTDIKMSGTTSEVISDLLVIVASVYDGLAKQNPELKELIKGFIRKFVNSDMLFDGKEDGEADD